MTQVTGTGKGRLNFAQVPLERARDYAAEDAEVALCLHNHFKPRLVAEHLVTVYETIERPLVPVLRAMEAEGVAVDREELRRLSNDFAVRLAELEKQIYKAAGREFNVGSPTQLGEILFDEMGLQLPGGAKPSKTKTGAYATGADVLEELAAGGHALPRKVLDWRQISKLKSTYTDTLDRADQPAHRPRPHLVRDGGRLDRAPVVERPEPAEHPDPHRGRPQDPPGLRRGEGLRAAVVRLFADRAAPRRPRRRHRRAQAGLPRRPGHPRDDRDRRCSACRSRAWTRSVRRRAKAINFGIIYGISAFGLANQLGIPQAEARAYIDAYFERYPGIRDYMDRTKELAREHGYVTTLFGRRCHVPGIADEEPGATQLRRARRDQRADPGRRRRHHQARDGAHPAGARRSAA